MKFTIIFLFFFVPFLFSAENEERPHIYKTVLTIAGSDSCGGAGVQADLKTFSALRCYGMNAITAITAQNTMGVQFIEPISTTCIAMQLDSLFDDIEIHAIKIGMLGSKEIIEQVYQSLKTSKSLPKAIVVDPVMYAKSGDLLLEEGAIDLLKEKILPLATVLTPNLHEACRILNLPSIGSKEEMESAAFALLEKGPQAVILKGGSLTCSELGGKDCLVIKGSSTAYWMEYPCVLTKNLHGSGCTFSAAIASFLAHGEQILPAVFKAKQYISQTIQEGAKYQLGHGNGPVLHFYDAWNPSFFEEAWKNAFPIYEKIKELSFIQKIKNASLPQEAFFSYLEQDCLFLFDRAKAFSVLSSRTLDPHLQKLLEIRAKDSFEKATKLFQQLSPSFQKEPKKMKSCELYTQEMLRSASEDSLCEALVFLLPCSYIYQEIGEYLQFTSTPSNPYQDWIDQYSNLERRKKVDEWIQMINQMAKPLCKEAKEQLKTTFSKASQFEYDFWDETYNSTCK